MWGGDTNSKLKQTGDLETGNRQKIKFITNIKVYEKSVKALASKQRVLRANMSLNKEVLYCPSAELRGQGGQMALGALKAKGIFLILEKSSSWTLAVTRAPQNPSMVTPKQELVLTLLRVAGQISRTLTSPTTFLPRPQSLSGTAQ